MQCRKFAKPINAENYPNFKSVWVHPIDLKQIEKNVNECKYKSTRSFFGDIKWIYHNTFVYTHNNESKALLIHFHFECISRNRMIYCFFSTQSGKMVERVSRRRSFEYRYMLRLLFERKFESKNVVYNAMQATALDFMGKAEKLPILASKITIDP